MAQVEQALYFILSSLVLQSNFCKGAVLNVGLGPGLSARAFLLSRYITRVVSCELQQSVIDTYRATYAANEFLENGRHTIRLGNAATIPANQLNPPFDFCYIDTVSAHTTATYDDLKAVVNRLHQPGALTATGVVCIEWTADVKIERLARQWMEDNGWTAEVVRPELADNGWARAANMLVYHPV